MFSHSSIELLAKPDGTATWVTRHDDTVRRPAGPWTPTLNALLRHLETAGYPGSPRMVGDGYDEHGNQVLGYVEGELVHPHAWSDEGIWHVGRLLRALHDATAGFHPPADATWRPWFFRSTAPGSIIGHGDTGPWNIVARAGCRWRSSTGSSPDRSSATTSSPPPDG